MTGPVTQTLEREVKLGASAGFELPELPGTDIEPRTLTSIYYDTADHRLAQAGITLRHRIEDDRRSWQLKLPHRHGRVEIDVRGPGGAPPPELASLVLAHTRHAPVEQVTTLRTRRSGRRVRSIDGSLADVTVDAVTVLDGPRVVRRFTELEVELVDGDVGVLEQIAAALRTAGASEGDTRPKALQALGLPATVDPTRPASDDPIASQLTYLLGAQVRALLHHDPGTRLGSDPEELHQMRVATRKLRAVLRAARPILDTARSEPLRAELGWLGGALGPVRDLDVMLERLRGEAATLEADDAAAFEHLLVALEDERHAARETMLQALSSDRYLSLLGHLERASAAPPVVRDDVSLRDIARREWRRLRRATGELDDEPEDQELHDLRIRVKRSRYAAEFASPFLPSPPARFVTATKALQDVLGDHQDACVALERLGALVATTTDVRAAFAAGQLAERERARRQEKRDRWPEAWERLARAGREAWR